LANFHHGKFGDPRVVPLNPLKVRPHVVLPSI
jgi:hypothetical protein